MNPLRNDIFAFLGPTLVRKLRRSGAVRHVSFKRFCCAVTPASGTKVRLPTFKQTEALGRLLGASASPGEVLLLHGDLGAGKTSFARGFARAAAKDPSMEVTSPTFLLANEYPVHSDAGDEMFKVVHMDLWRLKDSSSRPIVDFNDVFKNHVSLIEWPDRLKDMTPDARLDVFLEYVDVPVSESNPWGFADSDAEFEGADGRIATLIPRGRSWESRLMSIAGDVRALEETVQPGELLS